MTLMLHIEIKHQKRWTDASLRKWTNNKHTCLSSCGQFSHAMDGVFIPTHVHKARVYACQLYCVRGHSTNSPLRGVNAAGIRCRFAGPCSIHIRYTHTQNKNKPHQANPNRIAYVIFPQNVKNAKCIKCIGAQTIYQKNAHSTIHNSKHLLHSLIQCTAFVRSRPIININLFPQSKFDVLLINRVW